MERTIGTGGSAPAHAAAPGIALAVPGRLSTASGGYGYARRVLEESAGIGRRLVHWPLPMLSPRPAAAAVEEAFDRLRHAPAGWPLLIDGLALGTLPAGRLADLDAPVVALVHHPLALEHGLDADTAAWLADNERAALGACAGVIATSEATARCLAADYAVSPDRLAVARPGTDRPAMPPMPRASGGPVRLLSVGRIVPRKGHDVLIDALARMSPDGDADWRLTILGATDADPACTGALRALIARHGLDDRVRLEGETDRAGVEAAYAEAEIFVLASRLEGYGMAYAEAMAAGLAVVGTETGAIAEATLGAARLVPAGDADALAAALAPLVADAGKRAAL
ncbi:MAG: glycosyltransferase family 4 protein, partial [Paracoccaceae bacterium]